MTAGARWYEGRRPRAAPRHGQDLILARPRAPDYADKRAAILDGAARLFARQGFAATTLQDVADACAMSKSLIYHYWQSKEGLLFDVLESHLAHLVAQVEAGAAAPAEGPRARLHHLAGHLLAAYESADDRHAILLNDLAALDPTRQEAIRALERRIVAVFSAAIADLSPAFADQPDLLKPVTMSLLGMLNWHHRWHRPGGALDRSAYARLAADLVISGLDGVART